MSEEIVKIKASDLEQLKGLVDEYEQANEKLTGELDRLRKEKQEKGINERKMLKAVRAIKKEIVNQKGEIDMAKVLNLTMAGDIEKLQVDFRELMEAVEYYEKNTLTVIA
jgi:predicted RNase H-like nuclease (RuvC/YqgF family)